MTRLFTSIYDYFEQRRTSLFFLLGMVVVVSVLLALRIDFQEDISKIMPSDEGVEAINEVFENTDFTDRLVVLVSLSDTNQSQDNPNNLIAYAEDFISKIPSRLDTAAIAEISHQIDQSIVQELYHVVHDNLPLFLEESDYQLIKNRIQEDTVKQYVKGIYKSLLTPGGSFIKRFVLSDPLAFTSFPLQRIQEFQVDENFTLHDGYIVTNDNNNLLFFITPAQSSNETQQNSQLISDLDHLIDDLKQGHIGITTTYFGGVAVAVANANQVRKDVTLTVSIALCTLLFLILFFFRRFSVFAYLVLPTIIGGLSALGLMYLFRGEVSIIALGIGSVLLGITLDYSLHVFTHHRASANVKNGLSDLTLPILISSCTTAVAFLCLFMIRSEALRDLGLFAALSVLLAAICALVLLPHLLPSPSAQTTNKSSNTFLDKLAAYRFPYPKLLIALLSVFTCVSFFYAPNVQFERDLNNINFMSDKLIDAEKKLNAITDATRRGVYLMTKGKTLDEALENSKSILPTLDSLKENSLILNYTSVSSVLPSQETQLERITRWNSFWENENINSIRNQLIDESKEFGFRAGAFHKFDSLLNKNYQSVSPDAFGPLTDVVFSEYISRQNDLTTILSIARVDLNQTETVYSTFKNNRQTIILDKGYLISRFVDILSSDFAKLVLWSSIFVFILLHMVYGRLELAIITFLPVAISWLWTLALMAILGIKLNIINVIITTFIFGLGIDYAIFVMRGLLQAYKHGVDKLATYKTSILLSVITTLVGIGVMIIAKHPALKSIASVSIIGILSVVILSMVLQPIMFRWLIQRPDGVSREFPLTLTNVSGSISKYFIFTIGMLLATPLIIISSLIFITYKTKRLKANRRIVHYLCKAIVAISSLGKYSIIKSNQFSFNATSVLLCQQQSYFDIILLHAIFPNLNIDIKTIQYKNMWTNWLTAYSQHAKRALVGHKIDNNENIQCLYFTNKDNGSSTSIEQVDQWTGIPIYPVLIHGSDHMAPNESLWQQAGRLTVEIGSSLSMSNDQDSNLEQVDQLQHQFNYESSTPRYLRGRLFENYLYRGSISWYYMLVKVRLESNYELFDQLIPKKAHIVDIGCGYGFMDYLLMMRSSERTILGIDYDEQKIITALNCPDKNERIDFKSGDIRNMDLQNADVFILADIIHYLPQADQFPLLDRLVRHLNEHGKIIIRDGDSDLENKHENTKWTERFSTGLGFNKTKNELHFIASSALEAWAISRDLNIERAAQYSKTSNTVFVLSRQATR